MQRKQMLNNPIEIECIGATMMKRYAIKARAELSHVGKAGEKLPSKPKKASTVLADPYRGVVRHSKTTSASQDQQP